MALPATETFTGADGTQLSASASWTAAKGDCHIQSNACASDAVGAITSLVYWDDDVFNNDQYAEATVVAIASGKYIGLSVRVSGASPNQNGYVYQADSADASYLEKFVNGAYTGIDSGSFFAVNDVIRLEISGTAITAKINGGTDASGTDSSLASGSAGVSGYGSQITSRIDNWEGGNLGAAAPRRIFVTQC